MTGLWALEVQEVAVSGGKPTLVIDVNPDPRRAPHNN